MARYRVDYAATIQVEVEAGGFYDAKEKADDLLVNLHLMN